MKSPIERIDYIISLLPLDSYNAFARKIGLKTPQVFYDLKSGKVKNISSELGNLINKSYPSFNISWILTGEGYPIKEGFYLGENPKITKSREYQNQKIGEKPTNKSIPMYNFPVAAGSVETYNNPDDVKIVGHLNIPGAHKESVAIPAYGDSMYPTLSNGDWAVSRPISDPTEIVWGELYYIEWSDYKMYKRLLHAENEEEVVLWSDNQLDKIGDRPKFAPMTIKKEKIRKLRLVTEILKKPNY